MAYATVTDVQALMLRTMESDEQQVCSGLLDHSALLIDAVASSAAADIKKAVSCRMVIRALGDGSGTGVPMGATQGSMSALGYSQSWTISNGSLGEIYLSKTDKQLLGCGRAIGSYSPVEQLVPSENEEAEAS